MLPDDIKRTVLEVLASIAPELNESSLDPDVSFRDQISLDSLDYLNFVLALDSSFGVKTPEMDYTQLASLNSCIAYLEKTLGEGLTER